MTQKSELKLKINLKNKKIKENKKRRIWAIWRTRCSDTTNLAWTPRDLVLETHVIRVALGIRLQLSSSPYFMVDSLASPLTFGWLETLPSSNGSKTRNKRWTNSLILCQRFWILSQKFKKKKVLKKIQNCIIIVVKISEITTYIGVVDQIFNPKTNLIWFNIKRLI